MSTSNRGTRYPLSPEMTAEAAMRIVHLALLDAIAGNVEGTLIGHDPDFLHDFRVAVRRTRTALTRIREVFPADAVAHFKHEFAWLGDITGPTRDLDVLLIDFPEYEATLPESLRPGLAAVRTCVMDARRTRQARLAEQLRTPRYGRLIEDWRQFLERPTGMDREPPSTLRPVVELASERIASAVERVVARGDAISVDSRPRRFHELRIEAKKLRYQLEFFAALCEPEIMLRLVSALKRLQDILGAFQDHTVQVDIVRACSASWDGADSHSTLAQERLAVVLEQRRATDTQEFMTRWAEFTVGIPSDLTRQLVREP